MQNVFTATLNFKLRPTHRAELERIAAQREVDLSDIAREAIAQYLKAQEQSEQAFKIVGKTLKAAN